MGAGEGPDGWRAGAALLTERVARLPAALATALARPVEPPFDVARVTAVRTTGVGSSEAHARFLTHLLNEQVGLPARFTPLTDFAVGEVSPRRNEALVVFSQALSANARLALATPGGWGGLVVVTAARDDRAGDERGDWLRVLRGVGAAIVEAPGGDEFGTLMRVEGPMLGYAVAIAIARSVARALGRDTSALGVDRDAVCAGVARADQTVEQLGTALHLPPGRPIAFLAAGGYSELLANLRYKVLEGLLRPPPPVWDLLHFAHGPFQQACTGAATFLALTTTGASREVELLDRLASLLDPSLHRLVRLSASVPGPFAIFEHEALMNALVLRRIAEEQIDPARWPGRGRDGALYELAPPLPTASAMPRAAPSISAPPTDEQTAPELAARIADGARTAVVPLGATEQHGSHLPLATDTWIADALAVRFCARVPGVVRIPAVALGCSSEHSGFAGTLSLRPDTFEAVLSDLLLSLRDHGFERAFLFSAHGGNAAPLARSLPDLRAGCAPLQLIAFTDLAAATHRFHTASRRHGVEAAASGHHAGEFETSIVAWLSAAAVRNDRLAPGTLAASSDAQALFYPRLRDNAPSGTVGDPRAFDPARGEAYLEAWVDLLVDAYEAGLADPGPAQK